MAAPHTLPLPRPLPHPNALMDAVREVIDSNRADGYQPNRFVGATQYGNAANLLAVCRDLINNPETLEWLEKAMQSFPTLLTLEDFVCRYGSSWGFDAATIQVACARAVFFDQIAGHTRYS